MTEYKISILVERYDHAGDDHSHKQWVEHHKQALTICNGEEGFEFVNQLMECSYGIKEDDKRDTRN